MKTVIVKFTNYYKEYAFRTDLPLQVGATYDIVADHITCYKTPVEVIRFGKQNEHFNCNLRTITAADLRGNAAPRPNDGIKHVLFNEKKKVTTVVWKDDMVTMVKCQEGDTYNKEVGLAMCYMKRYHKNRGCFNETLKKYCTEEVKQ